VPPPPLASCFRRHCPALRLSLIISIKPPPIIAIQYLR